MCLENGFKNVISTEKDLSLVVELRVERMILDQFLYWTNGHEYNICFNVPDWLEKTECG